MWAQIVSLLLGVWLLVAPDVLGYGDPARTVERVIGPVVIVVAALSIRPVTRKVRLVNILTGLALLVAPWAFAYASVPAVANSDLVGMAVLALALVRGRVPDAYGGGWSALWHMPERQQAQSQRDANRSDRASLPQGT